MTRTKLKTHVGFALKFTKSGVIILPIDVHSEKPDEVIVGAVDATLSLEKIRSSRKLVSLWSILVFTVCATAAFVLEDAVRAVIYIVLLSYPLLLIVVRVFEWAQLVECETLTTRLRKERLLKDHLI